MSGNLTASSLLASHAMPSREPHVAPSVSQGESAGFDSLLAGLDQQGAPMTSAEAETSVAVSARRVGAAKDTAPSAAPTKLAPNVDAALSSLATSALFAPAAIPSTSSASASGSGAAEAQPNATSASRPEGKATVNAADLNSLLSPRSALSSAAASGAATPAPGAALGTISYVTKTALGFAPELGFQSLQTNTYLAPTGAASAALADLQAQGDIAAAARTSTPRSQSTSRGDAAVSPKASTSTASAVWAGGVPANASISTDAVAADRAAPRREALVSQSEDAPTVDVAPASPAATPVVSTSTAPVAATPTRSNSNFVDLSDLGGRLLDASAALAQTKVPTNAPTATAPIKQLQLNLLPEHLGAVAVTLKLTNGKLSVDVGVANPSALAEVEGQRETLVAKLQTGAQPLDSLVVHQQVFNAAPAAQTSSNTAQAESFGNATGHDSNSHDARDRAPRQSRTPTPSSVASPRHSQRSDLVV